MIFTRSLVPEILKCGLLYAPPLLGLLRPGDRMKAAAPTRREWWQKPGLGLMYQIEYRPGWEWDRDYTEFNAAMRDESGAFRFNGPFCRIAQWVDVGKEVASVDYHVLEIKWHDGICYFNTALTDWRTEKDYALEFAELSRAAGIPFMYYYSSVFDHNPRFDAIQPDPGVTPSFIGLHPGPEYIDYLLGQLREIVGQYAPDGLWLDWYWADRSTEESIGLLKKESPQTVITFNLSNYFSTAFRKLHYTTGEAHTMSGPLVTLRTESSGEKVPVFSNAWKWANLNRVLFTHAWELITPAGKWWQDHSLRDDPLDLARMAAMVMASGGKICPGVTAQMDGTIYPDQIEQLAILGDWYKPRKHLFTESEPLRYRSSRVPGVKVSAEGLRTVCALQDGDHILHLVNLTGIRNDVTVVLDGKSWRAVRRIVLEPEGHELAFSRNERDCRLCVRSEQLDEVDTIIRITGENAAVTKV